MHSYNYIYELFQAPRPANEWTDAWEFHEHPDAFPIADIVEKAQNRNKAIAHLGAWLTEHRLGELTDKMFTVDPQAADRRFAGRFASFQQAVSALQHLDESQFIHEHDQVQKLIDNLTETFTQQYGDYVLLDSGLVPTPMEEFLRKAQPDTNYFIGAVLTYRY